MENVIKVLILAPISFIYLFIIGKILGKKQVGELDFIDYVVGISIGSIAAEMATETQDPWYLFLISMSIFAGLDLIIALLGRKGNFFKKLFKGTPMIIVKDGKIDYFQLKKSKLDLNDLMGMARNLGYFDFNDINFAIFETTGELSIMPKADKKPVVCSDLKIKAQSQTLIQNVVVDGNISKFSLNYLKKDKTWLFERLKISNKWELKNILLATYNQQTDEFVIHYKKERATNN